MTFTCPGCGATDNLEVSAHTWVRLIQGGDETRYETVRGETDFYSDDAAVCTACHWTGFAADLRPPDLALVPDDDDTKGAT